MGLPIFSKKSRPASEDTHPNVSNYAHFAPQNYTMTAGAGFFCSQL